MSHVARCLLLGAAVAFAGCGSSDDTKPLGAPARYPVPGCESFDPAPCDILSSECQTRLFELAACVRGSDAGELPTIVVLSQADLQAHLEAEAAASESDPNMTQWEWALERLGLVAPGALEQSTEVSSDVQFLAGFYDNETKVVNVVSRDDTATEEESSSVLFHEFVHALQDRESDLTSFRQAHFGSYDATLAADAVIEGEAQFQQERYLASMLGFNPADVDWDLLFQNGVDVAEPKLLAEASPFTAAQEYFPYEWGARYIHLGWGASGHDGVLGLFASPPADTQVEMASLTGLAGDVAGPAIVAPTPPGEWTQIGEDELGAFGTFELLRAAGVDDARSLALAWRADELLLYAGTTLGDPSATALVWLCDLASEGSASSARAELQSISGLSVSVSGTRITVTAASDSSNLSWAVSSETPPAPPSP